MVDLEFAVVATYSSNKSEPRPHANVLKGIRVLDLTNVLSGPFCTYQMALLGAEVIKIENPKGGDLARQLGADSTLNGKFMGTSFLAQNAGKKSITLNLKVPEGLDIFKRLVATADVVVENFRPGVMQRLGLSYDVLKAIKPSLVYCAISGYGQTGPMKNNPAYDQIIQGLSGVMSVTGDEDAGSAPLRVGYPVCDAIGGITAAFSIVSALRDSEASGTGRAIDVAMLDSTIATLGWVVSNYLSAGVMPKAIGNQNMTAAPSGAFQTGHGLLNIAANKQEQFEALCRLLDREELIQDQRFSLREARKQNREALNAEITRSLLEKPAKEWELLMNAQGIPAGQVLSVPDILQHPQIAHRELVQSLPCELFDSGRLNVVRSGFDFSDSQPAVTTAPPKLGEHTQNILEEVGVSAAQLDNLSALGAI